MYRCAKKNCENKILNCSSSIRQVRPHKKGKFIAKIKISANINKNKT